MIKRNPELNKPASLSTTRAILIVVNYFLGFNIIYPIIGVILTQLSGNTIDDIAPGILNGIVVFTIVTTVWLAWPLFKHENIHSSTKNVDLKKILITYIMMYVSVLVISVVLTYVAQSDQSQNQVLIIEAMKINPTFVILSAVIMAPLVEEIVFRGVLYRKLRNVNRYGIAIAVSAISFGLMHVLQSILEQNFIDLPFVVVYIVLGLFFTKIYEETGKLSNAIILHFINNAVGIAAILFTIGS
jgi:membrane protease YdiL (CAAX protease family)